MVAWAVGVPSPVAAADRIFTIAGHGGYAISGNQPDPDGAYATDVQIDGLTDVAVATDGTIIFGDDDAVRTRVRRIDPGGRLSTLPRMGGTTVTALPDGRLLMSDGYQIYRGTPKVDMKRIAGRWSGTGSRGDGGPALRATFNAIADVEQAPDGSVLVLEGFGNRVRRIRPDGIVVPAAGTGKRGYSGDGGPAIHARLQLDFEAGDLAIQPDGGFLIADYDNNRIRRVGPDGIITTVVGDGLSRSRGDGGPSTAASIDRPSGVVTTADGGYLVAETGRIRHVGPDGVITTVAGSGVLGQIGLGAPMGDGGLATHADINPEGKLALTGDGFVFAELARIRLVTSESIAHDAVAVTGARRTSDGRLRVRYRSALPGVVQLQIRTAQGRRVGAGSAPVAIGPGHVSTRRPIPRGVYWVILTIRGDGGAGAHSPVGVVAGRRLPERAARTVIANALASSSAALGLPTDVGRCKRMTLARVDCEGLDVLNDPSRCVTVGAVTLRAGFASARFYPCARGRRRDRQFKRYPRWQGPSVTQTVIGTAPPAIGQER